MNPERGTTAARRRPGAWATIAWALAVALAAGCGGGPARHDAATRGAGERPARAGGAPTVHAGEMVYFADATRFTECGTAQSLPVAREGDLAVMQRAYLEKRAAPGAPLFVTFEGLIADRPRMEGPGLERTVVVTRFLGAWPDRRCPPRPR